MLRRLVASPAHALAICLLLLAGTAAPAVAQISFTKSTVSGATPKKPTSMMFGPDGRLYVAQQNGKFMIYEIVRNAADDYEVISAEEIDLVNQIPNHDDDGTLNTDPKGRQSTGIYVTGTALNPVVYLTSSDPRQGGGSGAEDTNLDTNSGILSRVSWDGAQWVKLDLVRGLPRSEENHALNGIAMDEVNNVVYIAAGGHTNKGAPSNNFAFIAEYALSAAILSVDLDAIGETTYDLPTLDDEDRVGTADANDPFGGNDGKNQAILDPLGPVQVYAPGYRNSYDVIITSLGRMYTVDNGANGGWGGVPVGEGTSGCTNDVSETAGSDTDHLHFIDGPGFYGGFPNPARGNMANTFNPSNPQSPVLAANPVECDYREPLTEDGALATWSFSTNGLAEYSASDFNGAMQGDLLTASFDNQIWRVQLNAAGDAAISVDPLFSNVGANKPLDVIAQGDADPFPGTIWTANYASTGSLIVYEPIAPPPCTGADDDQLDEDGDCYDNADELDNNTDPCSFADVPPDAESDCISDMNDTDDDNDGLLDTADPFAVDPDNGTLTTVPVSYTWENGQPAPGGLFDTGFTGLMTNATSDYQSLYDPDEITFTNGMLTVDMVAEGDALDALNTQEFGFQLGVDVSAGPNVFTAHTSIETPFLGTTPSDFQSMGLFIGNGDQDNYIKIVATADAGFGGVEVVSEVAGTSTPGALSSVAMPGPDELDLYLTVDQTAGTVQPAYAVTSGGVPGAVTELGSPLPVPASWLGTAGFGLAVGIVSTSRGPAPSFAATWNEIEVLAGAVSCLADTDCDDVNACTTDTCAGGICQFTPLADGTACDDGLTCTSPDQCTAGVCAGADICPGGQFCDSNSGQCEDVPCVDDGDCPVGQVCVTGVCGLPGADTDNDGLFGSFDPCPSDARNLCAGPVAVDQTVGLPIRINANAVSGNCQGDRVDCNGDTWFEDFGWNNQGNGAVCNLDGGCPISGIDTIFGCTDANTEDVFQCEHWDPEAAPPLIYSFDLPDGTYVVNLLFAATFKSSTSGPEGPGSRVFDILVEGVTVYDDFDQVVAAGGTPGTAVVRSTVAEVADGNGLQIELAHVEDNPAIKGIEVLADLEFTGLGTQPGLNHDILDSGSCNSCHGDFDATNHIEPWPTWSGSMMAQAGRDPLFWAALDVANNDLPGIGDWCLRCHTPKAWLAGRADSPGGSADGCGLEGKIDEIDSDFDGVECHLCHRMMENDNPPPGEQGVYLGNGNFWIDDGDCNGAGEPCRRGPYSYPEDGTHSPLHAWAQSDYHEGSQICGNCHNVTNPIINLVDDTGADTGLRFPVERTYDEWLFSDFAPGGPDEQTCQNCHMPDALVDPAYACDDEDNNHTGDMAIHQFAGGNTWIPEVLRLEYPNLNMDAALQATRDFALDMLQNRSASIDVAVPANFAPGQPLDVAVTVTNLSGHKLPTGYAEGRRMWLGVEARDGAGTLFWESGAYDAGTGVLTVDPQAKVYEVKHGIYDLHGTGECDTEDSSGAHIFHFVLNDCIAKDNRIPPKGFTGGANPETAPHGYSYAETSPGSGVLVNYDVTDYSIPVPPGTPGPVSVTATLRFQTSSKEYIEFLKNQADSNGFADDCIERTTGLPGQHRGDILYDMWQTHGRSAPVDMVSANGQAVVDTCTVAADCNDADPCTADDCVANVCQHTFTTSACDDGDACTEADVCDGAGACAGSPKDCSGSADQCNDGGCEAATGNCIAVPKADGIVCDDGLFCTTTDACQAGACTGTGDPCAAGAECNDGCNEAADNCLSVAGTSCTDDGNACTDDVCDGAGACTHPNNTSACDDGVFCNGADTCAAGACSTHAGDPCLAEETCNEAAQVCDPPPCAQLSVSAPVQCSIGRDCAVPVGLATQALPVSSIAATMSSTLGLDCQEPCEPGAATGDAVCAIDPNTCRFQLVDVVAPIDAFADGAAAEVTVRCQTGGSGQVCLSAQDAQRDDGGSARTCGDVCTDFECVDCLTGDCNQNGDLDAGDPICVLLCLIGQPSAGADCSCAADCNCLSGTEAADPICTVLRVIDLFSPDTCAGGGAGAFVYEPGDGSGEDGDDSADVRVRVSRMRESRGGKLLRVNMGLRGEDVGDVAGMLVSLDADGKVGRVRLSRRLRKAGFNLSVGRASIDHAVAVITPPIDADQVQAIARGRALRINLGLSVTELAVTDAQFGSRTGVPIRAEF